MTIKQRMIEEDGKLHILRSQDVEPILDQNARLRSADYAPGGDFRHAGRIPFVVAEEWARECGHKIGTKPFAQYVKKKLMDGDFAKLRVRGF
mgnify:CR=1 FL=1